eukprot:4320431-Prymnesium_polylepis.1
MTDFPRHRSPPRGTRLAWRWPPPGLHAVFASHSSRLQPSLCRTSAGPQRSSERPYLVVGWKRGTLAATYVRSARRPARTCPRPATSPVRSASAASSAQPLPRPRRLR